MAHIDDLVARRFNVSAGTNQGILVSDLDLGVMYVGKMAEQIYDLVVHPNGQVDVEGVAAAAMSLLAYLGQLGPIIDALEGFAVEVAPRHGDAA